MKTTTPRQRRQGAEPPSQHPPVHPLPHGLSKEPDQLKPGRRSILYLSHGISLTPVWAGRRDELQAVVDRLQSNRRFRRAEFRCSKRTPARAEMDAVRRRIRRYLHGVDCEAIVMVAAAFAAGHVR